MSVQLGISVLWLSSSMTLSVGTLGCTVYSVGGVYYYTFHRKSYNSQLYSLMCMTCCVYGKNVYTPRNLAFCSLDIGYTSPRPQRIYFCVESW